MPNDVLVHVVAIDTEIDAKCHDNYYVAGVDVQEPVVVTASCCHPDADD
jgi:hypothetical protein